MSFITSTADFSTLFLHNCVKNFQVHCTVLLKKKPTAAAKSFYHLPKLKLNKIFFKKNHKHFPSICRKDQTLQIYEENLGEKFNKSPSPPV